MKYISKQPEPPAFTDWKALANEDWQPAYAVLSGSVKQAVKAALMAEQGYLCCYCERRLTDDDSHIEHFRPQSDHAVDPLDYGNMLCSCQKQSKKGEPRHCGNRKGDWFDGDLLVSPLDTTCESRFVFTGDGHIKPASLEDAAASETIRRLGLDIPKLINMRANVIEPFLDASLDDSDMTRFVSGYLRLNERGIYGEFWTTIRYLFGAYATV